MALDRFELLYDWGGGYGVKNQIAEYYLSDNPNLTPEQIDLLYNAVEDKDSLALYPKLTNEQFTRFFNDKDFNKKHLTKNPNLTTEQIDLLYQIEVVGKNLLAKYPKLTDEQFLRAFNDGMTSKKHLAQNPSINLPANQQFASGVFNWKW